MSISRDNMEVDEEEATPEVNQVNETNDAAHAPATGGDITVAITCMGPGSKVAPKFVLETQDTETNADLLDQGTVPWAYNHPHMVLMGSKKGLAIRFDHVPREAVNCFWVSVKEPHWRTKSAATSMARVLKFAGDFYKTTFASLDELINHEVPLDEADTEVLLGQPLKGFVNALIAVAEQEQRDARSRAAPETRLRRNRPNFPPESSLPHACPPTTIHSASKATTRLVFHAGEPQDDRGTAFGV
jgi:hypothetical protein